MLLEREKRETTGHSLSHNSASTSAIISKYQRANGREDFIHEPNNSLLYATQQCTKGASEIFVTDESRCA